jgi:hypothetical protein
MAAWFVLVSLKHTLNFAGTLQFVLFAGLESVASKMKRKKIVDIYTETPRKRKLNGW